MADNVLLNAGSGGETCATDDVAGVQYQKVKLADGTADSSTVIAAGNGTNGNALRVTLASDSTGQVALAAGANAIGKLAANSGVDIGDVDVTSVPADPFGANADAASATGSISAKLRFIAGTGIPITGTVTVGSHAVTNAGTFVTQENGAALTSLQLLDDTVFAEDTAAQAADKGIAILAVRRDADTSLVGTDNDYANLQVNSTGSLKVAITSGAGSGGTSIQDNAAFTRGTTSETPIGGIVESSAPTLTNGNVGALSLTTGGALRVDVSSGGVPGFAEDAAHTTGDTGVVVLARRSDTVSSSSGTDGDYSTINTDANGRLHVITGPSTGTIEVVGDVAHDAVAAGNPVLVAGKASAAAPTDVSADGDATTLWTLRSGAVAAQPTFAGVLAVAGNGVSGTGVQRVTLASDSTGVLATVSTVTTVSTLTGGAVAHDGADSGNPVKVGAKCSLTLSDDTIVANGDRTDATSDGDGALLVRPQFPLGDLISERVSNTDGNSTAFTNFSATASTRSYVYGYSIFRTDAGTTPIYVDFRDGTAGSVLWSVVIPPNGGANLASPVPLFRTSANTALAFDVSAATSTVFISVNGCKSKV